jgi:hypothetical protein
MRFGLGVACRGLCYFYPDSLNMKAAGFALLFTGWLLVIAALLLLKTGHARGVFIVAGVAVEILGIALAARAYTGPPKSDRF